MNDIQEMLEAIQQISEADYDAVDRQTAKQQGLGTAIQYICGHVTGIESVTKSGPISYDGGEGALYLINLKKHNLNLGIDTRRGMIFKCRRINGSQKLDLDLTNVIGGVTPSNLMTKLVEATVSYAGVSFIRWIEPVYMLCQIATELNPNVSSAIKSLMGAGSGTISMASIDLVQQGKDFDTKEANDDPELQQMKAEFDSTSEELLAVDGDSNAIAQLFGIDGSDVSNIQKVGDNIGTQHDVMDDLGESARLGLFMDLNKIQLEILAIAKTKSPQEYERVSTEAYRVRSYRAALKKGNKTPETVNKLKVAYKDAMTGVIKLITTVVTSFQQSSDSKYKMLANKLIKSGANDFRVTKNEGAFAEWLSSIGVSVPKGAGRPVGAVSKKPIQQKTAPVNNKEPIADPMQEKKELINLIVRIKTEKGTPMTPAQTMELFNLSTDQLHDLIQNR